MGRFMPKKLKCRKLLKDEEQLFLHGLKLYHKKIYLANFLKRVDVIEEQVTEIKETLGGRFARSLERHNQDYQGVAFFAWSPDSSKLAVCGPEDCDEVNSRSP